MTRTGIIAERVERRRDAMGVWCPECDEIIAFAPGQYWDISKTMAMHERGAGHRPFYVRLERSS